MMKRFDPRIVLGILLIAGGGLALAQTMGFLENATKFFWDGVFFLGGLAFFFYGIFVLQKGLKKNSGKRLRALINSLTGNRALGLGAGAAIAILLQSAN